jgi:hypothetical protein
MASAGPELGPEIHRDYTFHEIPKLGPALERDKLPSLLPKFGGFSGYEYLQCPTALQRVAEDDGWQGVDDTRTYSIIGPNGMIDCVLLCKGSPMHDTDVRSNRRTMFVHRMIADVTGLSLETGFAPEEDETKELVSAGQDEDVSAKAEDKPELALSHDPVPAPTHASDKGKKK